MTIEHLMRPVSIAIIGLGFGLAAECVLGFVAPAPLLEILTGNVF